MGSLMRATIACIKQLEYAMIIDAITHQWINIQLIKYFKVNLNINPEPRGNSMDWQSGYLHPTFTVFLEPSQTSGVELFCGISQRI